MSGILCFYLGFRRRRRVRVRRNPDRWSNNSNKHSHFLLIPCGMVEPTARMIPIVARPNPISNMAARGRVSSSKSHFLQYLLNGE